MLEHLRKSPDLGFISTCFGNYPARQFLIPSLPSLILGRSTFALNLGGSIYLILGLILLTANLIKYFGDICGNYVSAIFLSTIWHFHYFVHFTFHYEQSIFPVSLTMISLSFLLNYLKKKEVVNLLLFGFSLLLLIHAYTSGLAVYFLGLSVLWYLLFKAKMSRFKKGTILFIIFLSMFSFLSSLAFRTDIKFASSETTNIQLKEDFIKIINHVVLQTDRPFFVSPIFQFLFLFSLLLSIFGGLGKEFIFVGLWIIAVIITSGLSKGYSYYGIPFRLHRATVIVPVLVILVSKWIKPLFSKKRIIYPLIIFLAITGFYYLFNYQQTRSEDKNRDFAVWLNEENNFNQVNNLIITKEATEVYPSFEDALTYYAPQVNVVRLERGQCDFKNLSKKSIFLVLKKESECYTEIKFFNNWVEKGAFVDLIVFEKN
ncbi:MAG: hypothetical protein R6U54_01640 [Candidatus Omnitrophota bacterium]